MVEKTRIRKSCFEMVKFESEDHKIALMMPIRPEGLSATTKRQYIADLKAIAMELEAKNSRMIIAYHREGDWWQMGGNSLLYYLHHLQPTFVLPKLRAIADRDYYGRCWEKNPGCAMIRDINLIMDSLKKKTGGVLVFDAPELKMIRLKKAYDAHTRQTYLDIIPAKEERFESMLLPKVMNPATRQKVDLLNKYIVDKVVNLPEARRQIYGMGGVEMSNWLALNFVKMTNGRISEATYYKQALARLDALSDWLVYTKKFNLFDIDANIRIAELIIETRERIQNDLAQI